MLLRKFGDLRHICHGLNGIFACCRLPREHDCRAAVINRICYIGYFCPGWSWIIDHGFQHFCSSDDPLTQQPAFSDQLLLNSRHFYKRDLNAKITPSDHDPLAFLADLLHMIHAGTIFDFCNDVDVFSTVFPEEIP